METLLREPEAAERVAAFTFRVMFCPCSVLALFTTVVMQDMVLQKGHVCREAAMVMCAPPLRDLDCLGGKTRASVAPPIQEVLQTLNDLISYFLLPAADLEHEQKQIKLRSLKNRQNLFKQEVSPASQEVPNPGQRAMFGREIH